MNADLMHGICVFHYSNAVNSLLIVIRESIILFSAYTFIAITPNYPLNSSYASSIKRKIMKYDLDAHVSAKIRAIRVIRVPVLLHCSLLSFEAFISRILESLYYHAGKIISIIRRKSCPNPRIIQKFS